MVSRILNSQRGNYVQFDMEAHTMHGTTFRFLVTMTYDPYVVHHWINENLFGTFHRYGFTETNRMKVGLAVQWNRNSDGASTLQLCRRLYSNLKLGLWKKKCC